MVNSTSWAFVVVRSAMSKVFQKAEQALMGMSDMAYAGVARRQRLRPGLEAKPTRKERDAHAGLDDRSRSPLETSPDMFPRLENNREIKPTGPSTRAALQAHALRCTQPTVNEY
ncbi:hypothetical protein NDU88_002552 [Pleurodeles waltl]|uniref:Uncharacterized protein n=1 Tax=Pleurodeles waltl TaxID=8319 RepID=A0AAV7RDQ3_PLEWA|nr:hypothetical protein NDU88_002552 [Pleurodeles waltl]